MKFFNANIFTPNLEFKLGSIEVVENKIADVSFSNYESENSIDCNGLYLIPGLIDIHTHGCNGHDFCDGTKQALDSIASYQLNNGITSFCPTTMTLPEDKLRVPIEIAANYNNEYAARVVGINMEGPFISPDKLGAQNPNYVVEPDVDMLYRLQKSANGLIKLCDIAPETKGALDFIHKTKDDFHISIAHTNCTYDVAKDAFAKGGDHLTHTFNAMPPIHHRGPGPIVAAIENGVYMELICDGQHVHYGLVRMLFKSADSSKICLISDSCEATGLEDGNYMIGGQPITKTGDNVVLKEHPETIAASATNLYKCFKHAVKDGGIKIEIALAAATINPAKSIGIDKQCGSIAQGKFADFLLVDKDLNIVCIYKDGKKVK